jgi:hypothetical protein
MSYPDAAPGINSLLNSFPAPPQQAPIVHFESKPVPNSRPAGVSALTAHFRAHPEVMNSQSFQAASPSPMQHIDPFTFQNSLPSNYSSPTGMQSLDQDQTASLMAMQWGDLGSLTMSPEMPPADMDWSHALTSAVDIPTTRRRHHRQGTTSRSHSFAPYPGASLSQHMSHIAGGCASAAASSAMPRSPTTSGFVSTGFTSLQIPAAQAILNHLRQHPNSAFPSSLITSDLAEIYEGRGWCLIGNCGIERANQKASPFYDPSAPDDSRKRVDHLYDHIRDKHFNCRPFLCTMWYVFSPPLFDRFADSPF